MAKLSLTELRDLALTQQRAVESQQDSVSTQLQNTTALLKTLLGDRAPRIFWLDERRWEVFQELVAAKIHGAWDLEYHGPLEQEFPAWKDFAEGGPGTANWTNTILAPEVQGLGTVVIRRTVDQEWLIEVIYEGSARGVNKPKTFASLEARLQKLV